MSQTHTTLSNYEGKGQARVACIGNDNIFFFVRFIRCGRIKKIQMMIKWTFFFLFLLSGDGGGKENEKQRRVDANATN